MTKKSPPSSDHPALQEESDSLRGAWGILLFGSAIGTLASLSTTTGTVVTLLGLLFTFLGGSLVSLVYQKKEKTEKSDASERKPEDIAERKQLDGKERRLLLSLAGIFSIGLFAGFVLGFALKIIDTFYIKPRVLESEAETRAEINVKWPMAKPDAASSSPIVTDSSPVPSIKDKITKDPVHTTERPTRSPEVAATYPPIIGFQGANIDIIRKLIQDIENRSANASISIENQNTLKELKSFANDLLKILEQEERGGLFRRLETLRKEPWFGQTTLGDSYTNLCNEFKPLLKDCVTQRGQ